MAFNSPKAEEKKMAFPTCVHVANGTTSIRISLTHEIGGRIDAGWMATNEHTICHDELSVASIINFTWHALAAAAATATLNDVDDIGIFPCVCVRSDWKQEEKSKQYAERFWAKRLTTDSKLILLIPLCSARSLRNITHTCREKRQRKSRHFY